jgi:succinate dehydrogenase/fumarate reductase flavoprotein subunit
VTQEALTDYRLVLIEWEDSFGCSPSWVVIGGDLAPSVMMCRSVGWLVYDGADCKVIVPHLNQADHPNASLQGCGDMTIPSSAIKSINEISIISQPPKAVAWTAEKLEAVLSVATKEEISELGRLLQDGMDEPTAPKPEPAELDMAKRAS